MAVVLGASSIRHKASTCSRQLAGRIASPDVCARRGLKAAGECKRGSGAIITAALTLNVASLGASCKHPNNIHSDVLMEMLWLGHPDPVRHP